MPRKKVTPETDEEAVNPIEASEETAVSLDEQEPAAAAVEAPMEAAVNEEAADSLPPEAFLPELEDAADVPDFIAFEPGEAVPEDPNGYDPEHKVYGEESPMEEGDDPESSEILIAPEKDPIAGSDMKEVPASAIKGVQEAITSEEISVGETAASDSEAEHSAESADTEEASQKRTTRRRSRKIDAQLEQPPEAPEAPTEPEAEKPLTDQQKFYALDFNALDRNLTSEQRQEWNAIYASYRGRSVMTGTIIGIDKPTISQRDKATGEMKRQEMYCAVVIPYRVRIVIPASEMWAKGDERPDFVLRNMTGAKIDFVIIHVDREAGFAIASRRLAMRSRRYYFASQQGMHRPDSRTQCHVLAVGPRRCLVECWGHDLDLTQREIRYTAIPDLRSEYHPGDELDCVVKEYEPEHSRLTISVKEVEPNPFDGADMRHPEGSRRFAVIAGKYAGGVFCNLPDGVVVMCNYSFHYEDGQFDVGDKVIVMLQQYEFGKKQIFGKIVAKW